MDCSMTKFTLNLTSSLTFAFEHSYKLSTHGHGHVGDKTG